ncbi:MAG: hypothetical protein M0018_09085, partial [Nitrospiraceae bacterium]|nr:hypothetical protein [Nitrospiraceae bacterium]
NQLIMATALMAIKRMVNIPGKKRDILLLNGDIRLLFYSHGKINSTCLAFGGGLNSPGSFISHFEA